MKDNIYVPVGQTLICEQVHVKRAVIDGTLKVHGDVFADYIGGKGLLIAEDVFAGKIKIRTIKAKSVVAICGICKRFFAQDCSISQTLAVKDYIRAEKVCAEKLVVASAEIQTYEVETLSVQPPQKTNLFLFLVRAAFIDWWSARRAAAKKECGKAEKELKLSANRQYRPQNRSNGVRQNLTHLVLQILDLLSVCCTVCRKKLEDTIAEETPKEENAA